MDIQVKIRRRKLGWQRTQLRSKKHSTQKYQRPRLESKQTFEKQSLSGFICKCLKNIGNWMLSRTFQVDTLRKFLLHPCMCSAASLEAEVGTPPNPIFQESLIVPKEDILVL